MQDWEARLRELVVNSGATDQEREEGAEGAQGHQHGRSILSLSSTLALSTVVAFAASAVFILQAKGLFRRAL